MAADRKKMIQIGVVVACFAGAAVAYFALSAEGPGEVKSDAAPQTVQAPPPPPPNAALQPKPMTEEESTEHKMQRRGVTAPEARTEK